MLRSSLLSLCLTVPLAAVVADSPGSSTGARAADPQMLEGELLQALGALKKMRAELAGDGATGLAGGGRPARLLSREQEERLNQLARETQALMSEAFAEPRVIYDVDDRRNPDEEDVSDTERMAARATAVLVRADRLTPASADTFDLPGENRLGGNRGLCTPEQAAALALPEERFFDEPNPGFCSGFKVGPRLMATAGHCITSQAQCESTRFVFGFAKTAATPDPATGIAAENVYSCTRIVDGELNGADAADWRVVEVGRDIDAPQVAVRTPQMAPIEPGDGVTVIGYPMGLPVKIAGGGTVRARDGSFFVANLDTYGGNSGSAVFNSAKLAAGEILVEGILVRGENDFVISTPCFASQRCPLEGCRGEDVTYASRIARALEP